MIEMHHASLSMRKQCELLNITRSNCYYNPRQKNDDTLLANEIYELWLEMPFYGRRKITAELKRRGHKINHKKVMRLMHDMNIHALYPKPNKRINYSEHKVYPYLLRGLAIVHPNQVWCTDITYIKMANGFMYLVSLLDI
jgi:putative transposase